MEHEHSGTDRSHLRTSIVQDPVCGMVVDSASAKKRSTYEGKHYYFCSAGCKVKFEAGPVKYLGAETVMDPVCGMDVDPSGASYISTREVTPHYFCSAGCKTKFEADPARYLAKSAPPPAASGNQEYLPDASTDPSSGSG